MSQNQIISALTELQELKRMQEELQAEIDGLQDQIKTHMTDSALETITAGAFTVTYKQVTSTRIDSTRLKKDFPDIYTEYGKTSTTKRFTVSAK